MAATHNAPPAGLIEARDGWLALRLSKGLAIEYERSGRGELMMDELRWIPMGIGKRPREELGFGGGLASP
jgi:hypothetical protein